MKHGAKNRSNTRKITITMYTQLSPLVVLRANEIGPTIITAGCTSGCTRNKIIQQLSPLVVLQAALETELSNNYHRWLYFRLHLKRNYPTIITDGCAGNKIIQQLSPMVVLHAALETVLSNNYHRWL